MLLWVEHEKSFIILGPAVWNSAVGLLMKLHRLIGKLESSLLADILNKHF